MDIGEKLELQYRVQAKDLAKALSLNDQDDFPEVFATSRMIALMEAVTLNLGSISSRLVRRRLLR